MMKILLFILIFAGLQTTVGAETRAVLGINIATGGMSSGPVEGVMVAGVTPGGPADRAGLSAGDVIVSINDEFLIADSVRAANGRLLEFMEDVAPGEELAIVYLRNGDSRETVLTAGELDAETMSGFPFMGELRKFGEGFQHQVLEPFEYRWRHYGIFAGMELVELTPELGRYFGTDQGLLVVRAPEDQNIGLQDGDVIQNIGGRRPRDPGHAMRILRSYEAGEELVMDVMRDKRNREIEFVLPEHSAKSRGDRTGGVIHFLMPRDADA